MSSRLRPQNSLCPCVLEECLSVCATFSKTVRRTAFLLSRVSTFSNLSRLTTASAFGFDLLCVRPHDAFFPSRLTGIENP